MSHPLERKMYLLEVEAEVKSESRALEESDSLCAYTILISMSCMHLCVPIGIQEIRRLSIDQSYEWNVDCAINTHVHATEPHVLSFEQHTIYSLFSSLSHEPYGHSINSKCLRLCLPICQILLFA